jgi:flagellar hook assembly protein FlgD
MTEIAFSLQGETPVRLTVYDLKGQVVEVLVNQTLGAGTHVRTWDARDHASGVYFYRLEAGDFSETRKMIMLK